MSRQRLSRWAGVGLVVVVLCGMAAYFFVLRSSRAVSNALAPLEKVPDGQTYVGHKVCGACHYDQLLDWKKTDHSRSTHHVPAAYKNDASCMKCHSTGLGQPGGFKSEAETPGLVGTNCEACHGPGSKHVEIAKGFNGRKLNADEEKYVRSSIYKVLPKNVCVTCHISKGHQKHPDY
jgi:hypothetical protein